VSVVGLHHVTATVGDPQQDVDFWIDVLGLRLVKRTVDVDEPSAYHLYYGNEAGTPGTIVSTIAGLRGPHAQPGAGQTLAVTFSVPPESLAFWRTRLHEHGIPFADGRPRFDDECLVLRDSSGLILELMAAADARTPWESTIDRAHAVRGLHSVAIVVEWAESTIDFFVNALGWRQAREEPGRIRVVFGEEEPGRIIDVLHDHDATPAIDGIGCVRSVALTVDDLDETRQRIVGYGVDASDIRDHGYFSSFQFRAPGGVLFEAATSGPGFLVDEDLRSLGLGLQLPASLESERERILARLPSVSV